MVNQHTNKEKALEALRLQMEPCHQCGLRDQAHGVVFGEGDPQADIVLIGEGPGREEDRLLRPFVGAAGQLLDKMLAAIEMDRFHGIYILNVVKCRPPQNRVPTPAERKACWPHLAAQLRILSPQVVVLLGTTAVQTLLGISRLSEARGRWHERGGVWFRATYHPAALLRNPHWKEGAWQDLQEVQAKILALRQKAGEVSEIGK